jgi:hypothetical protein
LVVHGHGVSVTGGPGPSIGVGWEKVTAVTCPIRFAVVLVLRDGELRLEFAGAAQAREFLAALRSTPLAGRLPATVPAQSPGSGVRVPAGAASSPARPAGDRMGVMRALDGGVTLAGGALMVLVSLASDRSVWVIVAGLLFACYGAWILGTRGSYWRHYLMYVFVAAALIYAFSGGSTS